MDRQRLIGLRESIEGNLKNCILPFWASDALLDQEHGGYWGRVTRDNKVDKEFPKALVLGGRLLWTFSGAYRMLGGELYAERAHRACGYMMQHFFDREFGGAYHFVEPTGEPRDDRKDIYSLAFFIYGLAAYYQAFGGEDELAAAMQAMRLIERHMKRGEGLYCDVANRDWSDCTVNERKIAPGREIFTMQLHLFEAYELLYRVSGDSEVRQALMSFSECLAGPMFDSERLCFHCNVDENYRRAGARQSLGHDCELLYLSLDAAQILGDAKLLRATRQNALQTAETIRTKGIDALGGLSDGYDLTTGAKDDYRVWWANAEGVAAMLCAYQLSGEEKFLAASEAIWRYILEYFVDETYGDWYSFIRAPSKEAGREVVDGYHGFDKMNAGKCPYHNARMCFQSIRRIGEMLEG